jgi:hypothetical protein
MGNHGNMVSATVQGTPQWIGCCNCESDDAPHIDMDSGGAVIFTTAKGSCPAFRPDPTMLEEQEAEMAAMEETYAYLDQQLARDAWM